MEVRSLKYNFSMGVIRMVVGMFFPIILMPYVNRILNPESIGKIEYVNTIVNYFVMFSALGIPVYGVREVAKYRNDLKDLTKIFLELSLILFFTNVIVYVFYFSAINYYQAMKEQKLLFYIFSLNILFTTFGFEWFYEGIEDQKFITIRSTVVKIISGLSIFLLVKNSQDYKWYALILAMGSVIGNIFNLINLKKYLKINKSIFKELNPIRHLKYVMITFAAGVSIAIFTKIDIIMLGQISGMNSVALYNMPVKFITLIKSVITVLGATLLPRLTNLYKENLQKYNDHLKKLASALLLYCFLFSTLLFILSEEIIKIFGGESFFESILTIKILSVIVIFSGIAYFTGIIILYSQKKDKIFLYAVLVASLVNFILNYNLIPKYNQNGAAVATSVGEICVVVTIQILARKEIKEAKIFSFNNIKFLFLAILVIIIFSFIKFDFANLYIKFIIKGIAVTFFYLTGLIIFKEETMCGILSFLRQKIKKIK
ncbi:MAG: flippase [Fusobacteriaceae bacterium]